MLLFSIKHNEIKINNILLLNQTFLNNNRCYITDMFKQGKENIPYSSMLSGSTF